MNNSNSDPLQYVVNQCREIHDRVQSGIFDYEAERAALLALQAMLGNTDWAAQGLVATLLGIVAVYAGYIHDSIPYFITATTAYENARDIARAAMVRANRAEAHRYTQAWDDALDQIRLAQEMTLSHSPQDRSGALINLKVNSASLHLVLRHDDLATLTLRSVVRQHIEQPTAFHHSVFFQAYRMLALYAVMEQDAAAAAQHVDAAHTHLQHILSPMTEMSWYITAHVLATTAPDHMPEAAAVYRTRVEGCVQQVPSAYAVLILGSEAQDLIAVEQPTFARWLLDLGTQELSQHFTPDLHALFAGLRRRIAD